MRGTHWEPSQSTRFFDSLLGAIGLFVHGLMIKTPTKLAQRRVCLDTLNRFLTLLRLFGIPKQNDK